MGHVAKLSLSGPTLMSLSQPQNSDLGFNSLYPARKPTPLLGWADLVVWHTVSLHAPLCLRFTRNLCLPNELLCANFTTAIVHTIIGQWCVSLLRFLKFKGTVTQGSTDMGVSHTRCFVGSLSSNQRPSILKWERCRIHFKSLPLVLFSLSSYSVPPNDSWSVFSLSKTTFTLCCFHRNLIQLTAKLCDGHVYFCRL